MPASRIKISRMIVLGDSLSDRDTFNKRKLFGFIPLGDLYEVGFDAPRGRFTNGFVWGDYFVTAIIEEFQLDDARKKLKLPHTPRGNADLADAILANEHHVRRKNEKAFSLNNDKHILYKGHRFARFYCEAGLTSYAYKSKFTFNIKNEVLRLILASLEEKQKLLLEDDKKYKISLQEKAETLIVEWSGANDLLTVNSEPTFPEVDDAVNARIANLESLIHQGYRNFVLLNLPDLSLTPRYQAKRKKEQEKAARCSAYFNEQLADKVQQVKEKYKGLNTPLNLSIFDVSKPFEDMYSHCEEYGFEKDKLKSPFIESEQFRKNQQDPEYQKEHISPADGYMFWDDIHPAMDTHSWLAIKFKEAYTKIFKFLPPQSARKCCKEAEDAMRHFSTASFAHLPQELVQIINNIHTNALSMEKSRNASRQEKGELLKQFIFELKCQSGNLQEIDAFIKAFTHDAENRKIIKRHNNAVFDFFSCKKMTRTEDYIDQLSKVVSEKMGQKPLTVC
ncbi:SGNH/GDSL hydrolase family protein [Fluoribacter dumoffii]|uniref:SGNH/GDSL hydrolase family protein n=1 Tax=Fluoribacter dumoffii TaxID=463 RepID=UPI002242C6EF|nr:SGNH/GDSL hydrolase family protein [Fluoribacter dumoffii]MCW8386444.1 SGNH/GDSL hydrolase family protein [Fluoribacter dumoffii]MCW8419497.1 SGNH/GDSL hydrolase family protein [Fluoribacter dumoffii]MCW8452628.1 SGNH/GDSL hydrolase family protein [Fluoribacter dumoffii]MCW8460121.1 SGNH/GDSL hydrolase family protein [Fluoribacter dumoffii]MCW8483600.1 SGNH/GDSL hydrolase family protein [Fluoribacter dumoffii]